MSPITITELDAFAPDGRTSLPRPRLGRIAVLGVFALGGLFGSAAGFTAAGGDSSNAVVPASAPSRPANAELQQRIEACMTSLRSAESLGSCILDSDPQDQPLKEYKGGVGRVM